MKKTLRTPPMEIRSLADLDGLVADLRKELTGKQLLYFRGQREDWPLLPSLARRGLSRGEMLSMERSLLSELQDSYAALFDRYDSSYRLKLPRDWNDWMWAAIAQHHGLPTRLLDWSEHARIALYFAVEGLTGKPGVLFAFADPTAISDRRIRRLQNPDGSSPVVNVRPYLPRNSQLDLLRIIAQRGAFTYQPKPEEPLDDQLGGDERQRFVKWTVPVDAKPSLLRELERFGIAKEAMFPTWDDLCEQILHRVTADR